MNKHNFNIAKNFNQLLFSNRKNYWIILAYCIQAGLVSLCIPVAIGFLINSVSFMGGSVPLIVLSTILLGVLSISSILYFMQLIAVENIELGVFAENYLRFITKLYNDKKDFSHIFWEIDSIGKNTKSIFIDLLTILLELGFGLVLISLYHPWFLIFTIMMVVIFILFILFSRGISLERRYELSIVKYNLFFHAKNISMDFTNNINNISDNDALMSEYIKKRKKYFSSVRTQNFFLMLTYIFGTTFVLSLGGFLVIKEQLSLGQLVASEIVISHLLYNFWKLGGKIEAIDSFLIGMYKLDSTINDQTESSDEIDQELNQYQSYQNIKSKSLLTPFAIVNFSIFLILILSLYFIPWTQTSIGKGTVVAFNANEREQIIDAPIDGRIKKWLVSEGSIVAAGDIIAHMEDLDANMLERMNQEREALIAKLNAAQKAAELAKKNLNRQHKLFNDGLTSRRDFERSEIEYSSLLSTEANASADLIKIDSRLSKQLGQYIKTTRAGIISRIYSQENNQILKSSEPIAKIVPLAVKRSVELFLPAMDLPLIHAGQDVRLQFEGWPSVQFSGWPMIAIGTFPGTVVNVDPSVDAKGTFRVLIVEKKENDWPKEKFLRQGMRAIGHVQLGIVKLGYELWRNFNGFPASIPEPLENNSTTYSK